MEAADEAVESQRTPIARPKALIPQLASISPMALFTEVETSAYLKVPKTTLQVWRCTNRVPLPFVKLGSHVRYRKTDLDAFIEDHLIDARSASGK